jgi:hypothetical protein
MKISRLLLFCRLSGGFGVCGVRGTWYDAGRAAPLVHLAQGDVAGRPVGPGHLVHDDADVLGSRTDGPGQGLVDLVDHRAQLLVGASGTDRDLDVRHVSSA